jgi:hypothetical protein
MLLKIFHKSRISKLQLLYEDVTFLLNLFFGEKNRVIASRDVINHVSTTFILRQLHSVLPNLQFGRYEYPHLQCGI